LYTVYICSFSVFTKAKDANFDGGSKIKYEPENLTEGQHAAIDETADRKTKNNEKEEEEAKDREGISQMEESTILTGDLEETNESLLLQSPQAQVNFHEDDHNLNPETPTKYLKKTLKSSSTEFSPPEEVCRATSERQYLRLHYLSILVVSVHQLQRYSAPLANSCIFMTIRSNRRKAGELIQFSSKGVLPLHKQKSQF